MAGRIMMAVSAEATEDGKPHNQFKTFEEAQALMARGHAAPANAAERARFDAEQRKRAPASADDTVGSGSA